MTNRAQDILLGSTLALLAGIWTWLVIETIPPGFGDGEIGARMFPLVFGVILLILAAALLLRVLVNSSGDKTTERTGEAESPEINDLKWIPALGLLAEIVLYGFLLEKIGFVLATPIIAFLVMFLNLRVRSLPKLLGMSFGLTFGCWLVFEKVMGIYLANGTWMNLG